MHVMALVVVKHVNAKIFFLAGSVGFQLDDLRSVQSYDGQNAAYLLIIILLCASLFNIYIYVCIHAGCCAVC